jgi:hypothetical protein
MINVNRILHNRITQHSVFKILQKPTRFSSFIKVHRLKVSALFTSFRKSNLSLHIMKLNVIYPSIMEEENRVNEYA